MKKQKTRRTQAGKPKQASKQVKKSSEEQNVAYAIKLWMRQLSEEKNAKKGSDASRRREMCRALRKKLRASMKRFCKSNNAHKASPENSNKKGYANEL